MQPNFNSRTIWVRDNLHIMRGMNSECIDLIYLDPPFKSDVKYRGLPTDFGGDGVVKAEFNDMWKLRSSDIEWHERLKEDHRCLFEVIEATEFSFGKDMKSYLIYMTARLFEMHRILKSTGSIYFHCDYHASHYIKVILDCIFGKQNFRNEIIWHFPSMSRASEYFPRKNNNIFFYSKSALYTFNSKDEKVRVAYKETTKERSNYGGAGFKRKEGAAHYLKSDTKLADTVWSIPHIKSKKEHVGYPTQKPVKLLERILSATSNEGDMVLDPFCGCATTLLVAEKLKRRWAGIDISPVARFVIENRLERETDIKKKEVISRKDPPVREDVEKNKETRAQLRQRLYIEQDGVCNGCKWHIPLHIFNDDHKTATSRGGQDVPENIQLLCGTCNSIKGDRDMNYLHARLKKLGYSYDASI